MEAKDIVLVRHAETRANRDGVWQGHGDSPITARGRRQIAALGARLAGERFDVVVASDLARTRATVAALDRPFEPDAAWREADIGGWEGLTREEVAERFDDQIAALIAGRDVAMGGGETMAALNARVVGAFSRLVERTPPGGRALAVTHGGAILAVIRHVLGFGDRFRWGLSGTFNASVTRIRVTERGTQLAVYNDDGHLGGDRLDRDAGTALVLVRHAESEGNVAGRWQGRTDGSLTDHGRNQAGLVAGAAPPVRAVYSSPLRRAQATGAAIAAHQGVALELVEALVEIDLGVWEGLTTDEIRLRWPDAWRELYERGVDLPRGDRGETWAQVAGRMTEALDRIAADHPGEQVGVVSHGGALRAYVASMLGLQFPDRMRIPSPDNTAMGRIVFSPRGPLLSQYNLTSHLRP